MAERDLTMKFGTELKAGGDEALRQIGRAALTAKGQTDGLWKSYNEHIDQALASAKRMEEQLKKTFQSGSQELDKLNAQLSKFDRQFRDVAKAGLSGGLVGIDKNRLDVQARPGMADHAGEGFGTGFLHASGLGMLLNPGMAAAAAALGAFTLAVDQSEKALHRYYASLEFNPKTGQAESNPVTYRRNIEKEQREAGGFFRWLGSLGGARMGEEGYRKSLPASKEDYEKYMEKYRWEREGSGLWHWLSTPNAKALKAPALTYEQFRQSRMAGRERDVSAFLARQAHEFAPATAGAHAGFYRDQGALALERSRIEAEAHAVLGMRRTGHQLTEAAGQARRQMIPFAAANPLYGREQQIEDINRQIGVREALLRSGSEGKFRQESIRKQLGESEHQEGQYRQRYEAAAKREAAAKAEVEAARRAPLGSEEVERRAQLALAAVEQRKQAETSLIEAQRRSLDLRKQGEASILQTQEQQHNILRENLNTIQHQIEAEKRRQRSLQEQLGLMKPAQLRTAVGVLRKYQAGHPLTTADIGFMQGHGQLFGKHLEQIGRQRATQGPLAGMIQELMRGTMQNARQKELEKQEIAIKQQIEARVVLDAGSVTEALVESLRPAILSLMSQFNVRLKNELDALKLQMNTQRRSLFPEVPG